MLNRMMICPKAKECGHINCNAYKPHEKNFACSPKEKHFCSDYGLLPCIPVAKRPSAREALETWAAKHGGLYAGKAEAAIFQAGVRWERRQK